MLGTGMGAGVQKDIVSIPPITATDTGRPGRRRSDQKNAGPVGRRKGDSCDLPDQPRNKAGGVPHRCES